MPAHGHAALTHDECRARLCVCCGTKQKQHSTMSAAQELLVKVHGLYTAFDRSNPRFPTALCSTCQQALYKIKSNKPPKGWGGPHPPAWDKFKVDTIFGVRKGGLTDGQGKLTTCDLCQLVRSSPVGNPGPTRSKMLLPRGAEQEPPGLKLEPAHVLCPLCFGKKGPGLPAYPTSAVQRQSRGTCWATCRQPQARSRRQFWAQQSSL